MRDDELDTRLAALEARAPAAGLPPALSDTRPVRRRFGSPGLVAVGLTLVLGASAVAAGVVLEGVRATEGVQNAGQPLHGAKMECLSPPEAEAFLAGKGFTDVIWQVESRSGRNGSSDGRDVRAWLYTIALRLAFNQLRGRRRWLRLLGSGEPWTWNDIVDPDLLAALRGLDARTRSALLFSAVDGYTQREIAEMLGVPEGTVASWISRGRASLRERLTRPG